RGGPFGGFDQRTGCRCTRGAGPAPGLEPVSGHRRGCRRRRAAGFGQGLIRTRFNVPSFVVTLGGLLLFYGLQLYVLGDTGTIRFPFGQTISQIENVTFEAASSYLMAVGATAPTFPPPRGRA